jgi:hypothetical protein
MVNELNRWFSKEVQMPNEYMKECSTSLATSNMRVKVQWDPTSPQSDDYHKENKQQQLMQSLLESVQRFLKKLKVEIPYEPAIPLLYIHLNKSKSTYTRDTHVYHCTIHNSQVMKLT